MENNSVISLDVGDRRVGIAIASRAAKIASPYGVIDRQKENVWEALDKLINDNKVGVIAVGLPRGLNGQETAQTKSVRDFAAKLKKRYQLVIHFQDEALTSQKAEDELGARHVSYNKGDVDALAATYILSDFLAEHTEV